MSDQHQRIFIVGHIGSGKTLIAKSLANKLGWQFIDADLGLEHRVGRSQSEIFGKQGLEALQHCECAILKNLISKDKLVIATDGGVLLSEKSRKLLANEFVVHLKVSTTIQLERLAKETLPLLPIDDRKVFLDHLHKERDAHYDDAANFAISTNSKSLEEVVKEINSAMQVKS